MWKSQVLMARALLTEAMLKVMFYGHWRDLFLKKTLNLVCGLNFNNFQERNNYIDFEFLPATFLPLGSKKNRNLLAIPFFLSSHTHSYLLILWKYKNQVFLIFNFLMSFQLTSLRYSQGTPTKKQTHFYWKF
jgi:hypothetical protein